MSDDQPDYRETAIECETDSAPKRSDDSRAKQKNHMPPGLEAKGDQVIDPELQAIIRRFKERFAR